MAIKVALFGQLKELTPGGIVDAPAVADTAELQKWLEEKFPLLSGLPYLLAIDKKIASGISLLRPGQEVAVLPPYSGG